MKKVVYNQFGNVDVLEMMEAEMPAVKKGMLLIKVKAAAINPVDWKMREGQLKFMTGRKFPQGLGLEFAGIVEKVGRGVANYKVGDEVFGTANHSLAEYVVAKEKNIWRKPANVSFEQASTIPVVGECAFNVFDKLIAVKKGSEVLINGATGGIGMYVTQIAKQRGAIVTAVVSPKGIALVQKWGVDFVVNYREIDILTAGKQYGVVVELSDKLLFKQAKAIMKPTATYVASLPIPLEILSGLVNNLFSSKKYKLLGTPVKPAYMAALANDAANGAIDIVIGKAYPLTAFKEAYAETAHGKFVGQGIRCLRGLPPWDDLSGRGLWD